MVILVPPPECSSTPVEAMCCDQPCAFDAAAMSNVNAPRRALARLALIRSMSDCWSAEMQLVSSTTMAAMPRAARVARWRVMVRIVEFDTFGPSGVVVVGGSTWSRSEFPSARTDSM